MSIDRQDTVYIYRTRSGKEEFINGSWWNEKVTTNRIASLDALVNSGRLIRDEPPFYMGIANSQIRTARVVSGTWQSAQMTSQSLPAYLGISAESTSVKGVFLYKSNGNCALEIGRSSITVDDEVAPVADGKIGLFLNSQLNLITAKQATDDITCDNSVFSIPQHIKVFTLLDDLDARGNTVRVYGIDVFGNVFIEDFILDATDSTIQIEGQTLCSKIIAIKTLAEVWGGELKITNSSGDLCTELNPPASDTFYGVVTPDVVDNPQDHVLKITCSDVLTEPIVVMTIEGSDISYEVISEVPLGGIFTVKGYIGEVYLLVGGDGSANPSYTVEVLSDVGSPSLGNIIEVTDDGKYAILVLNPDAYSGGIEGEAGEVTPGTGTATGDWKESVRVATDAPLVTSYADGILTGSGSINDTGIDGITDLVVGQRILVKNQVTGSENGIYTVGVVGSLTEDFQLVRAGDADTSEKVTSGMNIRVEEGGTYAGLIFYLTNPDPITLDTTSLVFIQSGPPPVVPIFAEDTGAVSAVRISASNQAGGAYSFSVGQNNVIGSYGHYGAVVGGRNHLMGNVAGYDCYDAFIGGGKGNSIISWGYNAIIGGTSNKIASGLYGGIVGGYYNRLGSLTSWCDYGFIGGGSSNYGYGRRPVLIGGDTNNIYQGFGVGSSVIIGGNDNTANCERGFIVNSNASNLGSFSDGGLIIGGNDVDVLDWGYSVAIGCWNTQFPNNGGFGNVGIVAGDSVTLNTNRGVVINSRASRIGPPAGTSNLGLYNTIITSAGVIENGNNCTMIGGDATNLLGRNQHSSIFGSFICNINAGATPNNFGRNAIIAGYQNTIGGVAAVQVFGSAIIAGRNHILGAINTSDNSLILGGRSNSINASYGIIGSGSTNTIMTSTRASIFGGQDNSISGDSRGSLIGAGIHHEITDSRYSVILGGDENTVYGQTGSWYTGNGIIGGSLNQVRSSYYSGIVSGFYNHIGSPGLGGYYCFIGGGEDNMVTGNRCAIIGGDSNSINDMGTQNNSVIIGGQDNIVNITGSVIIGGNGNTITDWGWNGAIFQSFSCYMNDGGFSVSIGSFTSNFTGDGGHDNVDIKNDRVTFNTVYGASIVSTQSRLGPLPGNPDRGNNNVLIAAGASSIIGGSSNGLLMTAGCNITGTANPSQCSIISSMASNMNAGTQNSILGGWENNVGSGSYAASRSAIIAGRGNSIATTVGCSYSIVLAGRNNAVNANFGTAAGYRSKINHANSFVWADGTAADFSTTAANQFLVRASGGIGLGTNDPKAQVHGAGSTILGAPTTAEPDGDLQNASVHFWIDESTPGSEVLMFKVKLSGGTVKSGQIALA